MVRWTVNNIQEMYLILNNWTAMQESVKKFEFERI